MSKLITEREMIAFLIANYEMLSPVEFVEEYNRQMGTDYTIDDVEWEEHETIVDGLED